MLRNKAFQLSAESFLFLVFCQSVNRLFYPPIVCNRGVGFALGGETWLVAVALRVGFIAWAVVLLLSTFRNRKNSRLILLALVGGGLLLGGAVSNLLDRVIFGCVPDYFQPFPWFPAFNMADIGVCSGALSLLYLYFSGLED